MIIIVIKNLEYEGEEDGFEFFRDLIYDNDTCNTGCLGATYSPIKKVGIFTFIQSKYIPQEMSEYPISLHPCTYS